MASLKDNCSCALLDHYLNQLVTVKGRSPLTAAEYRIDCNMLFEYVKRQRGSPEEELARRDFSDVDIEFIRSVTSKEMYDFLHYCSTERKIMVSSLARKIISIKQFWKYLATKAHLLEKNAAEELETPKLPKRMPKFLSLDESIRLLLVSENSPRDYCILTLFLNCALRLSELVSLDVDQVDSEAVRIIGKGNKERSIFHTPATKRAIAAWMECRKEMNPQTDALFITKHGTRMTTRAVQDVVKKYLKKAELDGRGFSTHKLRHTAATTLFRFGHVDIRTLQMILGHDNINTTTIYTSVSSEQLQSAVNSNPLASMFGR